MTAVLRRVEPERGTALLDRATWAGLPPLAELVDARHGGRPRDTTIVRAAAGPGALHVLFDCDDRDVWATHARRDAALWEEEAVEVFLASGEGVPGRYVEIEISPAGVLFDALVLNPDGRRDTMRVDAGWTAAGLIGRVSRPAESRWCAELSIPWHAIVGEAGGAWRANFFRIERPRGEPAEFSAWSPTGADPPDFHKPAAFGHLVRA